MMATVVSTGLRRWLASLALVLPLGSGCRTYWPLSPELEERIRSESEALSPPIDDAESVRNIGEATRQGELPLPEAFELPEGIGIDGYVALALERNPSVQARIRDLEALGLRVPQVTSLPNPMLGLVPDTGDMVETAGGMMGGSIGLSQGVPFPSKLKARGKVAEAVVRVALANLRTERLGVVAEVKKAYYDLYATSASLSIARESESLLRRLRDVAEAMYRAGTGSSPDVLRAEVELYQLGNKILTLDQRRRTAIARLNALMDRDIRADVPAPPLFDPEEVPWRLDTLIGRATAGSSDLEALREQVGRDLEAVKLARLQYLPDFTIGGAWTFISNGGRSAVANGDDAWNLALGVELPIWLHRIRAEILERQAALLATSLRFRRMRNDVFVMAQDFLTQADTSYRNAILLRDAILPRARQTVAVSESAYRAGQVDFLSLIESWRRLLDVELDYHRSLADLERSFADLERLVGETLPRGVPAAEVEP
jgi:outer membrane protein TolC